MTLSVLDPVIKMLKWYKELFFHLVDLAICNAYILHRNCTGIKYKFSDFHIALTKKTFCENIHKADAWLEGKKKTRGFTFSIN